MSVSSQTKGTSYSSQIITLERMVNERDDTIYNLIIERDKLALKITEWEKKASTWLSSPDAQKQLDGYRELAQRVNTLELQRDELLETLIDMVNYYGSASANVDELFVAHIAIYKAEGVIT